MDFKTLRKAAGLTLKEAAERSGYTIGAINGEELHGNGSDRLRAKLLEVYSAQGQSASALHDGPTPAAPPQLFEAIERIEAMEVELRAVKSLLKKLSP